MGIRVHLVLPAIFLFYFIFLYFRLFLTSAGKSSDAKLPEQRFHGKGKLDRVTAR